MDAFDKVWIDSLNGDKYKSGKLTPDGHPDPSVFSTEWNREGIQVGTAIGLLVRQSDHSATKTIRLRHLWGTLKRSNLLESLPGVDDLYDEITPPSSLGFPFTSQQLSGFTYLTWPSLPDLFPLSYPGVKTSRDDFLIDIDRERLISRLERYFNPAVSNEEMRRIAPSVMTDRARFKARDVRERLVRRGFLPDKVVRYCYRPFDLRWLYWEPETKLLDEKRDDYFAQVREENLWLEARQKQTMERFDRGYVTTRLADNFGNGLSSFFPIATTAGRGTLFANRNGGEPEPNLSTIAQQYADDRGVNVQQLFLHTIAILHAHGYDLENHGALRQDWPRVPIPESAEMLEQSALLGTTVAKLFNVEQGHMSVTEGTVRAELSTIGVITAVGGGDLNPGAGDLAVTAGWGHAGKGGVKMPGRGRTVARDYTTSERAAIEAGAASLELTLDRTLDCLGRSTFDIYLNDRAYWRNVPSRVWQYTIGGYQVLKKWLSYREAPLLGRPLTADEVREVMNISRRIAALLVNGTSPRSELRCCEAGHIPVARGTSLKLCHSRMELDTIYTWCWAGV